MGGGMRPSATFRLGRLGWLDSQARVFVVCALVFAVLAGARPCLVMIAEPSAPSHCAKHRDNSQLPCNAPPQEPCKKAPELCCVVKSPAITVTSNAVSNIASLARQENIDQTRNAFLACAVVLNCSASFNPLHSVLRI